MRARSSVLLAGCLMALAAVSNAAISKIVAPCSACKCMALELQARLDKEPVRNHLDMRHRLDKDGKRYGKVIDYKMSELRAIEMLEGLCYRMKSYTLVSVNATVVEGKVLARTQHWEHVNHAKAEGRPGKLEEEARQKQLELYCGRVVEEHEDDISTALREGTLGEHGAVKYLCHELLGSCPVKRIGTKPVAGQLPKEGDVTEETMSADELKAEAGDKEAAQRVQEGAPPPAAGETEGGSGEQEGGAAAEGAAGEAGVPPSEQGEVKDEL